MSERATRKPEISFLDRFEGKTSKMSKQGITGLLEIASQPAVLSANHNTSHNQRPSGIHQANLAYRSTPATTEVTSSKYSKELNLDTIIPSQPQKETMKMPPRVPNDKERRVASISKSEYVPSFTENPSHTTKIKTLTTLDRQSQPTSLADRGLDNRYHQTRNSIQSNRTADVSRIKRTVANCE